VLRNDSFPPNATHTAEAVSYFHNYSAIDGYANCNLGPTDDRDSAESTIAQMIGKVNNSGFYRIDVKFRYGDATSQNSEFIHTDTNLNRNFIVYDHGKLQKNGQNVAQYPRPDLTGCTFKVVPISREKYYEINDCYTRGDWCGWIK
jgi:hypothetical protein